MSETITPTLTLKQRFPELYGFDEKQLRAIIENIGNELEDIFKLPKHEWWMLLSIQIMQQSRFAREAVEAAEAKKAKK